MLLKFGRIYRLSALVALVFMMTANIFGQLSFRSRRDTNLPSFNGPIATAVADFNGDGAPDLAVANAFEMTISILLGDGRGGFTLAGTYLVGVHPFSISVHDYNHDNKLDFSVANYSALNYISVFLGNGDGTFGAEQIFHVSAAPTTVASGDLNNDGHPDIAVACFGPFAPSEPQELNKTISILLGDGTGQFRPPACGRDFEAGLAPEGIALGDFDGDGNLDIAVANLLSNELTVLLGDGSGCFPLHVNYPVQLRPSHVIVGDFNNDRRLDLTSLNEASYSISFLAGIGDGSFQAARHFPSAPPRVVGVRMIAHDFNLDGNLDLAVAGAMDEVRVTLGDGHGRFIEPIQNFKTGAGVTAQLGVADFNNDGAPDLITMNKGVVQYPMPPARFGNISLLTGDGVGNFGHFIRTSGEGASSVTTGDFNGDKHLDLAVAHRGSHEVTIYLGDGKEGFLDAGSARTGRRPVFIATGDFNGDGRPDLATANAGSQSVTILLGGDFGAFPIRRDFSVGNSPSSLTVADFNQDRKLDLAVTNSESNDVTILLGDGAGHFSTRRDFMVGSRPSFVTAGDINHDNKLDLAIAGAGSDLVTVLLGDGHGRFPTRLDTPVASGSRPLSLTLGDFNSDSHLDIATSNNGLNNISVLLGDGSGRFPAGQVVSLPGAQGASYIVSTDLNGDGRLDLAVANSVSNNVAILQGDGKGNFFIAITPHLFIGLRPSSMAMADLNNDRYTDLVFANSGSGTLSILMNDTARCGEEFYCPPVAGPELPALNDWVETFCHRFAVTRSSSRIQRALNPTATFLSYCAFLNPDLYPSLSFKNYRNFSSQGDASVALMTVDFDSDKILDLAVANTGTSDISIMLGDGMGGFINSARFPAGAGVFFVTADDLNGDDILDLVAANFGEASVSILMGDGTGRFSAPKNFPVHDKNTGVVIIDVNGDGIKDIVSANFGQLPEGDQAPDCLGSRNVASSITVLLGQNVRPDVSFPHRREIKTGCAPEGVYPGDFNGDKYIDIMVTNFFGHTLTLLLGDQKGEFTQAPRTITPGILGPAYGALGDFNADGRLDFVSANWASHDVSILLGDGQGNFQTPVRNFSTQVPPSAGRNPRAIVVGDFNNDKHLDLATSNYEFSDVSVLLGDGKGNFSAPKIIALEGSKTWFMTGGDFNQDGNWDFAVLRQDGLATENISILTGDGFGNFGQFSRVAGNPVAVAAEDLNGDGLLDLVVANVESNDIAIRFGDGRGGFGSEKRLPVGKRPVAVVSADLENDGLMDLVTANFASNDLTIWFMNEDGQWAVRQEIPINGSRPNFVIAGDFNRDGLTDLATANVESHNVSILLAGRRGGLMPARTYPVGGEQPWSISVGDLNGDGHPDLVTANAKSNDISILLGSDSGDFSSPIRYQVGKGPRSLVIGDYNRDGKLDIAVALSESSAVPVLYGDGRGGFSQRVELMMGRGAGGVFIQQADLDRDGYLDLAVADVNRNQVIVFRGDRQGGFLPPLSFFAGLGPVSLAVGDFNGDGRKDLAVIDIISQNLSILFNARP